MPLPRPSRAKSDLAKNALATTDHHVPASADARAEVVEKAGAGEANVPAKTGPEARAAAVPANAAKAPATVAAVEQRAATKARAANLPAEEMARVQEQYVATMRGAIARAAKAAATIDRVTNVPARMKPACANAVVVAVDVVAVRPRQLLPPIYPSKTTLKRASTNSIFRTTRCPPHRTSMNLAS